MLKLETIRISPELKSMISVFYLKIAPQYEKPASKPKPYNINIEAVGGSSSYGKSQPPSKLSCLSVRRSDLRIMLISHCSKIVQQRDLSTARAKTSNPFDFSELCTSNEQHTFVKFTVQCLPSWHHYVTLGS